MGNPMLLKVKTGSCENLNVSRVVKDLVMVFDRHKIMEYSVTIVFPMLLMKFLSVTFA